MPKRDNDSSHGKVIVAPTPRRNVRLERPRLILPRKFWFWLITFIFPQGRRGPSCLDVDKLRAGDDVINHIIEAEDAPEVGRKVFSKNCPCAHQQLVE
jgi:hypothetical protein